MISFRRQYQPFSALTPAAGNSFKTSLIAYYGMEEASSNAIDSHGSSDLTSTGTDPGSTTGKVGNCRDFTGGHFDHVDSAALSVGDIDFTLSIWVNLDTKTTYRMFIAKWLTAGNQLEYLLYYDQPADRFILAVSPDGTAGAASSVSANNLGSPSTGVWYHIIAWHDSVNNLIGIEVNDGTANTTSHSTGVFNGSVGFKIGSYQDTTGLEMDGKIDEVGFWKRMLTVSERTDLYNSGNGRAYSYFQ